MFEKISDGTLKRYISWNTNPRDARLVPFDCKFSLQQKISGILFSSDQPFWRYMHLKWSRNSADFKRTLYVVGGIRVKIQKKRYFEFSIIRSSKRIDVYFNVITPPPTRSFSHYSLNCSFIYSKKLFSFLISFIPSYNISSIH